MKKIVYFAAACVALVACSKEIDESATVNATAFEEGQKVVLTVGTNDQTKVSSALNTTTGAVDFKWETGDKIKVTVNSQSAEFTLKSGAGESTATFEGTMPAAGNTFDVQYPVTDPDLTSQTYVANALPKDKMKMAATGCTLGTSFTLNPQYAALRLNLYGYTPIGSIVVTTNESTVKTYTLDCKGVGSTGTEPSKTNTPKPFFVVMSAGTYGFTVSIKNVSDTELNKCSTTSDKTFATGVVLKMPCLGYPYTDAKPVKVGNTTWAPVNCGYDPTNYKYGKLYQWGRAVGGGYNDGTTFTETVYQEATASVPSGTNQNTNPDDQIFYKGVSGSSYDWYTTTGTRLSGWPIKSTDTGYVEGKIDNPCPEGWHVSTYNELNTLLGGSDKTSIGGLQTDTREDSPTYNMTGLFFDGTTDSHPTSGVFLPVAGYRGSDTGNAANRGNRGHYFSSSICGVETWGKGKVWYMYLISSEAKIVGGSRAGGCSVRCVQD